jgi:hypothetical protein
VSRRWARLVFLVVVALSARARAYRPFDQTDADVAELHVIELELGPLQFQRSAGRTGYVPTFIFNYGAIFGWELVVEADGSGTVAGPRAPGEVFQLESSVSFKGVVRRGSLQDGTGVSIAVEPEVLLPATAGASGFGFAAGVIVSQRWPALAVHLNLVPEWSRGHNVAGRVGFIAEGPDEWTVRPVGEVYVEGRACRARSDLVVPGRTDLANFPPGLYRRRGAGGNGLGCRPGRAASGLDLGPAALNS